jgi:excisionase family DNA binding protein
MSEVDATILFIVTRQSVVTGQMTELKDYLTVPEAAAKRGVSRQAILHLIKEGKLKATQMGPVWLIHKDDLAAYTPGVGGRPSEKRLRKSPKASETRRNKK